MKKLLYLIVFCAISSVSFAQSKPIEKVIDDALNFSLKQSMLMYDQLKDTPNALPKSTKDGKLAIGKPEWWTSGFYPGTLWYLYEYSGDSTVRAAAEVMTLRVETQKYTTDNHDVGFIINCSFGNGYRLTGKESYREVITTAASSLATRFNENVGCTRSWNNAKWQFPVIIDNMMNLELMTVAASFSNNMNHYKIAKTHADKTLKYHFRDDGSSFHVVDYDTITGAVRSRVTHQGFNDESAWARGQAWALYGYTMMYRQSGDEKYLDMAVKIGKYIMNHPRLPKDKIPYWDFDAPNIPKTERDASAGAIMASAYTELSTYVNPELSKQFRDIARQQIVSLASPAYLAKLGANANFILEHSVGHLRANSEVNVPLPYADYYFVEALMRYKKLLNGEDVVDIRTVYSENEDRAVWLSVMDRIARPLLTNMAKGELKKNMPIESGATNRANVTHLEALGRILTGMAPWLELGQEDSPEGMLRKKYLDLAHRSIANGVNPDSPDYLNFTIDRQPLVDAAFLAHAFLRSPKELWGGLDKVTKERVIKEFKATRVIESSESNWLFFTAMIEVALKEFAGEWEYEKVKYTLDRHAQWYKGDGWYGDGAEFRFDYYNSFVIQPMMRQVLDVIAKHGKTHDLIVFAPARYTRYAAQLERLISPEATYPAIGRSLPYRFGAFHALADVAFRKSLPADLAPSQVRAALTAVIKRQISMPETFDTNGWLTMGFAGHQPSIGEFYLSTGSLYLCSAVFIPLGLKTSDPFWSAPSKDWTSKRVWQGEDIKVDKALKHL